MSELTWLQAQVPRDEWEKLNKRRIELGYKWSDIILPAVKAYMPTLKPKLKADKDEDEPATRTKKAPAPPKAKSAKATKAPKKAAEPKRTEVEAPPDAGDEEITLLAGEEKPIVAPTVIASAKAEEEE